MLATSNKLVFQSTIQWKKKKNCPCIILICVHKKIPFVRHVQHTSSKSSNCSLYWSHRNVFLNAQTNSRARTHTAHNHHNRKERRKETGTNMNRAVFLTHPFPANCVYIQNSISEHGSHNFTRPIFMTPIVWSMKTDGTRAISALKHSRTYISFNLNWFDSCQSARIQIAIRFDYNL